MFGQKVVTHEQLLSFYAIFAKIWAEENYEFEDVKSYTEKYLFYSEKLQNFAGTAEIGVYRLDDEEVEKTFNFKSVPHLAKAAKKGQIGYIDKLAILRQARKDGLLSKILTQIVDFSVRHNISHFVALIDPLVARMLTVSYHVPVVELGAPRHYKGDDVTPIEIDMNEMMRLFEADREKYGWYWQTLEKVQTAAKS